MKNVIFFFLVLYSFDSFSQLKYNISRNNPDTLNNFYFSIIPGFFELSGDNIGAAGAGLSSGWLR